MPDRILSADMLAALDKFIAEQRPDLSRADALRSIAADWLIAQGYLKPVSSPPEGMDAANDDGRR